MEIKFTPEYYVCAIPSHFGEDRNVRKAKWEKYKAALEPKGFKTRYEYRTEDAAKAMAEKIKKATRVKMEVYSAFGMSF